ncbi:MAG TPA: hypothetical protein EYQ69_07465 [Gemmatimonadetes bacterium]|nr:hypothetical protein [Gemmatimonadota bacterium]
MTKTSTKLSKLLPQTSLEVGEVQIPNWLAKLFKNQSTSHQTRLESMPKRFLEELLGQKPDKVIEMITTVGSILSELSTSDLQLGISTNLEAEEEVWTHALVETQHWFSNQIVWGWKEDPFERPKDYEMGGANGFFYSCLELTRHFLLDGGNPEKAEDIKKFLRENGEIVNGSDNEPQLKLRWPGWDIYKPRKQSETIHLKRIKRSQKNDETRDEFFGRILADVAEETIIQMCMSDKEAYFQNTTFQPRKSEELATLVNTPEIQPELLLLKVMFGDMAYDSNNTDLANKISSAGHHLGFFRKKTRVDRFMEDFADRALPAQGLAKKIDLDP